MKVIKRDGAIVDYDRSKIVTAIQKANAEVPEEERLGRDRIDAIIDHIESLKRPRMLVEDIQDLVEQGLVAENKFHLAKTYIIYRYNRALVRKANTTDESILSLLRKGGLDIPLMFLMDKLAGIEGIVWATPIADCCALAAAIALFIPFWRRFSQAIPSEPASAAPHASQA